MCRRQFWSRWTKQRERGHVHILPCGAFLIVRWRHRPLHCLRRWGARAIHGCNIVPNLRRWAVRAISRRQSLHCLRLRAFRAVHWRDTVRPMCRWPVFAQWCWRYGVHRMRRRAVRAGQWFSGVHCLPRRPPPGCHGADGML